MDLSNLSLADLRKLQEDVKEAMKQRERQEIEAARVQITEIARSVGVPLAELVNLKGEKKAGKAPAQFRNPDNFNQEWSGRGRQPQWVKVWLESGKPLDELKLIRFDPTKD